MFLYQKEYQPEINGSQCSLKYRKKYLINSWDKLYYCSSSDVYFVNVTFINIIQIVSESNSKLHLKNLSS